MTWVNWLKDRSKSRRVSQRRTAYEQKIETLEIRALLSGSGIFVDGGQSIGAYAYGHDFVPPADFNGDRRISVWLNQDQDISSLPADVTLPAEGGAFRLRRDDVDLVLTDEAELELFRASLTYSTQLVIRGSSNADALTVDFTDGNPIREAGIVFDGGAGNDRVELTGGSAETLTQSLTDSNDGRIRVDDKVVVFGGVASISDQLGVNHRVFQFGSGPDAVTMTDDDSARDDVSRLSLAGGLTTDFTSPSSSLSLMAGRGADSVMLTGADDLLTVRVSAFGGVGDDILVGSMAGDSLSGGEGNDTLNGRGGHDTLIGGVGIDKLLGGSGRDSLAG